MREKEREKKVFSTLIRNLRHYVLLSPSQMSKPYPTVMISIVHKFNTVSVDIPAVFMYFPYISDFCP